MPVSEGIIRTGYKAFLQMIFVQTGLRNHKMNKIYPTLVLIVLGTIFFILIKDFLLGIFAAIVLSFFLLPLFRKMEKKIPKRMSSFLLVFVTVIIISLVLFFISKQLVDQISQYADKDSIMNAFSILVDKLPFETGNVQAFLDTISGQINDLFIGLASSVVTSIPNIAINVIITFFITYYLLINWNEVGDFMKKVLPVKREETFENIRKSSYGILYGLTLIAVIEFIVAGIGFYIAGINLYIFFALITAIAAFIPMFGPIAVWLPIFLYYAAAGNWFSAITILVTGLILTLGIDGFLIHIILGKTSKINPVFMMLGVLGGIAIFGLVGFIVGPIIMVFFIEYYKEYIEVYT